MARFKTISKLWRAFISSLKVTASLNQLAALYKDSRADLGSVANILSAFLTSTQPRL